MKEIMKLQMRQMILMTILIAFILSPTSQAWSVTIVPTKEQKSLIITSDNEPKSDIIQNHYKDKESKLSKKEIKKMMKAKEPNLLPETNLEWFFLLVSGVGLFLGILNVLAPLSWLIFAGGLITYLFYKLLKN